LSAGALPQTPLGELTGLPRPSSCIRWPLLRERREEEGKDRAEDGTGGRGRGAERGGPEREGKRREWEGPHDPLAWGPPMS